MAYTTLINDIQSVIKNNGNQEITGQVLQTALVEMVNELGSGYTYKGVATLSTTPDVTTPNIFYLLGAVGIYTNIGGIQHASGIGIALWNGTAWSYQNVPSSTIVATDATPTEGSINPVQSGGVYTFGNGLVYNEETKASLSREQTVANAPYEAFHLESGVTYELTCQITGMGDQYPKLSGISTYATQSAIGKVESLLPLFSAVGEFSTGLPITITYTPPATSEYIKIAFNSAWVYPQGNNISITAKVKTAKYATSEELQQVEDLLETTITPAETTWATQGYPGSGFYYVSNVCVEGVAYTATLESGGSWTRLGFAATNNEDWNNGDVVKIGAVTSNQDFPFIAPDPTAYPYIMYYQGSNKSKVTIVKDAIVNKGLIDKVGDIDDLETTDKTDIVSAINEVNSKVLPLSGKNVLMFGDSITQMPHSGTTLGNGIVEYFAEITGANVKRCAIGGSHLRARRIVNSASDIVVSDTGVEMQQTAKSTLDLVYLIESLVNNDWSKQDAAKQWFDANDNGGDAEWWNETIANLKAADMSKVDVITIFIGTNDYANAVRFVDDGGTPATSTNIQREDGAWNYVLNALTTTFPNVCVMVFTPVVKKANGVWCEDTTNSAGLYLHDYAQNNIDAAKRYFCPACDLFYTMGWTSANFLQFAPDGTHPTNGFQHIARKMAGFVTSNLNRF